MLDETTCEEPAQDVIISGGENISSPEVEDALYRHPAVQECAVIGVPHDKWGETPKAIVVRRPGTSVTSEELTAFCRQQLAHFKCPTSIEFTEALPRTARASSRSTGCAKSTGKAATQSRGMSRERSWP